MTKGYYIKVNSQVQDTKGLYVGLALFFSIKSLIKKAILRR